MISPKEKLTGLINLSIFLSLEKYKY